MHPLPLLAAAIKPDAAAGAAALPAAAAPGWMAPGTPLAVLAPYGVVFITALVVSLIATPVMGALARANGVVDHPDARRKNHARPIAYLGGVAIFLGWFAGLAAACTIPAAAASLNVLLAFLIGAAAVHLTGLFDDVITIRARMKIGGQLFAAAALASQDVGVSLARNLVTGVGLPLHELSAISVPLTGQPLDTTVIYICGTFIIAVFVLGFCNSVNLIDGLDGLAAGVTAIAAVGFLGLAVMVACTDTADSVFRTTPASLSLNSATDALTLPHLWDPVRFALCLAIIGALLGFLPYNFNPASIFMGDAGSLLLGYLGAAAILSFSDTGGHSVTYVVASLIIFAIPITDTSLAIVRRKLRGFPIFAPDNEHIHHLIRRTGLSVRASVLVLYGIAVLLVALGWLVAIAELQLRYVIPAVFALYVGLTFLCFRVGGAQLAAEAERKQQAVLTEAPTAPETAPDGGAEETARGDTDAAPHPAGADTAPAAAEARTETEPDDPLRAANDGSSVSLPELSKA